MTISNYRKYFYFCEDSQLFIRKYSLKGTAVKGTAALERLNGSGSPTVILDKNCEVLKSSLVWHWYSNTYTPNQTFVYINGNQEDTNINNLIRYEASDIVSPYLLDYLFTVDLSTGVLVPNYKTKLFKLGGYIVTSLFNHTVGIHRILYSMYTRTCLVLKQPPYEIDHINHNTLDNTQSNLRAVPAVLNKRNRSMNSNNTSGYNGIRCVGGSFLVEIASKYLGSYDSLDKAIRVRDLFTSSKEYHENHGKII